MCGCDREREKGDAGLKGGETLRQRVNVEIERSHAKIQNRAGIKRLHFDWAPLMASRRGSCRFVGRRWRRTLSLSESQPRIRRILRSLPWRRLYSKMSQCRPSLPHMKITWILKSSPKTCFTSGCVNFFYFCTCTNVTRLLAAAPFRRAPLRMEFCVCEYVALIFRLCGLFAFVCPLCRTKTSLASWSSSANAATVTR